jgi:hypothetical protein
VSRTFISISSIAPLAANLIRLKATIPTSKLAKLTTMNGFEDSYFPYKDTYTYNIRNLKYSKTQVKILKFINSKLEKMSLIPLLFLEG